MLAAPVQMMKRTELTTSVEEGWSFMETSWKTQAIAYQVTRRLPYMGTAGRDNFTLPRCLPANILANNKEMSQSYRKLRLEQCPLWGRGGGAWRVLDVGCLASWLGISYTGVYSLWELRHVPFINITCLLLTFFVCLFKDKVCVVLAGVKLSRAGNKGIHHHT